MRRKAADFATLRPLPKGRTTPLRSTADEERSNSAPFFCQGVGPRHARLRLRVAPVPLGALDGRCVAPLGVSAPEECRSLSHQRNAGFRKALAGIGKENEGLSFI